jgi:hypothetical protein
MGLGQAKTPGFIVRAKYKSNWDLYSMGELKKMYQTIMDCLHQKPFGEYRAMNTIFGEDVALRAAERGDVIAPASATGGKRKQNGIDTTGREQKRVRIDDD